MATSAIGPGFLTQTTKFTADLLASFGFVILISLLLDIGAQLNIWRIIAVSNSRAQDVANKLLPGLGFGLACLISFGGLVFNIGNIAGCGLGMNAMAGIPIATGAVINAKNPLGKTAGTTWLDPFAANSTQADGDRSFRLHHTVTSANK